MLSVPKNGWTKIMLDGWCGNASYLTDVPNDVLDSFINLLKNRKISSFYCDAEGWEYIIVLDFNIVYLIEEKDETKLYSFNKKIVDLAEEVYSDISQHLNDWVVWNYDIEDEDSEIEERLNLSKKLKELRRLIDKEKNRCKA